MFQWTTVLVLGFAMCCEGVQSNWSNTDLEKCMCWDEAKDTWCSGDDSWDQCEDYWNQYGPYLAISFFGLTLVFVGAIVYYVVRCLTACKKQCLAPNDHGVKVHVLYLYRFELIVAIIGSLIATAVASHLRHTDIYDGLHAINTTLTEQTGIVDGLRQLYLATTEELMAEVEAVSFDIEQQVLAVNHNLYEWMHNINDGQDAIMSHLWVLDMFIWPSVVTAVALLVCNILRFNRYIPEVLVFCVAITCLATFALQFTVGWAKKSTYDVCDDYDNVADTVIDIIDTKIGGCNATGRLGGILNSTAFIETAYVTESCLPSNVSDTLYEACEVTGYFTCSACSTMAGIASIIQDSSRMVTSQFGCLGCTISECADNCTTGSTAQLLAQSVTKKDAKVGGGVATLKEKLYPVAECTQFREMMLAGREAVCAGFKPNINDYYITAGAAAFVAMLAFVLATLGNIMYHQDLYVYNACAVPVDMQVRPLYDEETALRPTTTTVYSTAEGSVNNPTNCS